MKRILIVEDNAELAFGIAPTTPDGGAGASGGGGSGIVDVSFSLERGSFTVITGRIGAGKTTLLNTVLGLLPREAGVVRLRFGLTDGQPRTLDEIGQVYGVTRERIRQIESKTMSKLRHPSRSQVLRDYLD